MEDKKQRLLTTQCMYTGMKGEKGLIEITVKGSTTLSPIC